MSKYTVARYDDVPDYTGEAPGAFKGFGRALEASQLAFNVRRLEPGQANTPPGSPPDWGHSHTEQEEIYFVVAGSLTLKLDDDEVSLDAHDAVRISPATVRAARNDGDEDAVFAMVSIPVEDIRAEATMVEGFWR